MPEKILTGIVSNYNSEHLYDPEGDYYVHYKFSIDGHALFCKTDKDFNIYDGHKIVVKIQEEGSEFKVIGMINLINDTSFGKTSGLKTKAPEQKYRLIHSFLKEKRQVLQRVYSSSAPSARNYLSYTLILENGEELHADKKTGRQIKIGDEVYIFVPEGKKGVAEFYDKTTGANSKPSFFQVVFFCLMFIISTLSICWYWHLPWSQKGFIVMLGGLFGFIGLIATISEALDYSFLKKRYAEFLAMIL